MKKALIITYYWPPSGGAGVQRWLKFAKYLPQFGWQPVIYTPENGEIPVIDNSLLKDVPKEAIVIKTPIWEPYSIYKKFIGQKKGEKINTGFLSERKKPSLTEKLSVWIRGNFFIPDARIFWIKPSIKFLEKYLKDNPVDVIISTGPPHSMHLIALGLKKKLNIPWVADFRDPWTNIDFYSDLMLTSWADKKHHRLEKKVLHQADCILTIGETMKQEFIELGTKKVEAITNGYDEDDVYTGEVEKDKKFSIAHIGTLVKSRNPEVLWKVLSELTKENKDFEKDLELKLVGKVDFNVMESIKNKGLNKYLNKIEYLNHSDVIKAQQQAQVLLLILNNTKNAKGILTGKFFEYLAAKTPILCVGPEEGDAGKILKETKAGKISGFEDETNLKNNLLEYYRQYKSGTLIVESSNIGRFSRKSLTAKLAQLLTKLSS